jgi:hypothetical protein
MSRQYSRLPTLVALAALVLSACDAGNGEGLDQTGRPIGEAPEGVALAATYDSIESNVFAVSCALSGCHSGPAPTGGLDLSPGQAYGNLVDQRSSQRPDLDRVEPGRPQDSYLVRKLRGEGSVTRMPFQRDPLPDSTIGLIEAWISAGAPRDSGGAEPPPRVTGLDPEDGSVATTLPGLLTVTFDKAMDAATFADLTVQVTASGEDGTFDDGNETTLQPLGLTLDDGQNLLQVDLSGFAGGEDCYQLRLRASGPAVIRDTLATVLDGDGDGLPGGDFIGILSVSNSFGTVQPTFESLRDNLFDTTCAVSGCHSGSSPQAGMNLESAVAYENLLNPSRNRVVPGDSASSLIYLYVESEFMPLDVPTGFECQRQQVVAAIKAWIDNGALP